ncbi:MAG: ABC transporter substrate-binding protein [Desulfovibrio sp.]|nr:ABC transporter substrate-binding protein [Desulfovibrio sp.]MBI4958061.1 ABC transporter substrate-binding protein [Desulfovibrio sp.]
MIKAALIILLVSLVSCESPPPPPQLAERMGVTQDEIRIGASLPLSGHASYLGQETLRGAVAYLDFVNAQGGVHGRKIRLITRDDGYDPPRCVANTQQLVVEDQVFALSCYVGTPTTTKILPMLVDAKVPLVGAFTGAYDLREPFQRYVINVRPSYYQETSSAVKHFVDDLGTKRIGVFYQFDAYGFDGLKGTELALRSYGLAPVARGSYARGTMDVEEGLAKILEGGAQAVVIIGTSAPSAKFIKLAMEKDPDLIFYAVSFVGAEEIAKALGPDEKARVLVSQVMPPPDLPETQALLWGVREYDDLLRQSAPGHPPTAVGLEGFINAKVLVEGLKRAGPQLDRERFIEAVESIRDFSLGLANTLGYAPGDHQGLERVYFTKLESGRFVLVTDWSDPFANRNCP